jgi:RpiR family transcriptional regulator, carbohydrate utilization regulator
MNETETPFLARIEAARDRMTASESKVASLVLSKPNLATQLSISQMADQAGVSEPSVARFCKAIGFSGIKEFKLQLARSLARSLGGSAAAKLVFADETAGSPAFKVIDRSIRAETNLRDTMDSGLLAGAAKHIARAGRLDFYGQGNSGIVALDGQHKFFRMGLATGAYSDPHVHAISAALLNPGDVVIAVSDSDRTLDLTVHPGVHEQRMTAFARWMNIYRSGAQISAWRPAHRDRSTGTAAPRDRSRR